MGLLSMDLTPRYFGDAESALQRHLERIRNLDPKLRAFITVADGPALAVARDADRAAAQGTRLGPLHGWPIVLKDSIDVASMRCTAGSAYFAERIAETDATLVARLRAAGAVILGKTNLHEFCYGGTTQNETFGGCRNPWDTDRIPGGSSGGSAVAVACGMAPIAIGGDTGASIRLPSSLNGVCGLRPTVGAIPNTGTFPVSPPYDTHGPIARSVADLARAFAVMAGHDRADPMSRRRAVADVATDLDGGVAGLTVLIPTNFFFDDLSPGIGDAVLNAARVLEAAGARLSEARIPDLENAQEALNSIIYADAASLHEERLRRAPERIGRLVRERLKPGLEMSALAYVRHRRWLEGWEHRVAAMFEHSADVVLSPSVPCPPPRVAEATDVIGDTARMSRFCWAWAAARVPALSIPCGFDPDGLPIGLQLATGRWRDALVLRVGHAFQRATEWHRAEPSICGAADTASPSRS